MKKEQVFYDLQRSTIYLCIIVNRANLRHFMVSVCILYTIQNKTCTPIHIHLRARASAQASDRCGCSKNNNNNNLPF